jgi:LysR substrate binding domain
MSQDDELGMLREVRMEEMNDRNWILLGRHANAHLYDTIQQVASGQGIHALEILSVTSPEEAAELILEHRGLALLPRTGAWRIARDGITMRPLA